MHIPYDAIVVMMPSENQPKGEERAHFLTTVWNVVLAAAQEDAPGARDSLTELCQNYWQPIYVFIRHQHYSEHDSEDLTQEFFAHLLANRTISRAERARGRFRSFLLGALRRFLADQAVLHNAQKRGAGCEFVSLHMLAEPDVPATIGRNAEDFFEARWARALLDATLARLREEWMREDKAARLDTLQQFLPGVSTAAPCSYREAAAELGINEAALKSLIHRLRTQYRAILRREVARTVVAPHEIDDEIRHLCAAAALLGDERAA